ncbi:octaprenyl-diphosphate synthase [Formivibrio citricus]|uniref:Octaprenyl diphosphate synthase n=1 Tax=Formivibrio citricus TaxID=83765 RepID=A0A1I5C1P2_9NEIS|nr:octaprenyl diphosphate synthase [Formivibrio citricus]SFN80878.1 octaprenyl-diphosphate synthase [Formivibrio citricus]
MNLGQKPVSAEFVRTLLATEMQAVDGLIRSSLHSTVPLVDQIAEYIISAGGKRLRPQVVLLSALALGYRGNQHRELAAVIEFIHTATLLHDDVVDESELRRGRKTANALFGNAASVLVGDFLYSRAFQMMAACNSMRVMQALADATNVIAEGEVLQLMNIGNTDIDEAGYLKVIRYKTAKLFEAAARLGAILCDAPQETETGLANYGLHLGAAFQIIDDVLDYNGNIDETGKNVGDDLAEGKATLPLIHVMREGTPEQAAVVRAALEQADRSLLPQVLAAVGQSGALDYARGVARGEAALAIRSLESLPDSPFSQALRALPELAIKRTG